MENGDRQRAVKVANKLLEDSKQERLRVLQDRLTDRQNSLKEKAHEDRAKVTAKCTAECKKVADIIQWLRGCAATKCASGVKSNLRHLKTLVQERRVLENSLDALEGKSNLSKGGRKRKGKGKSRGAGVKPMKAMKAMKTMKATSNSLLKYGFGFRRVVEEVA